jgi:hypothetical protein
MEVRQVVLSVLRMASVKFLGSEHESDKSASDVAKSP